jgi:hypothetical protein
MSNHADDSQKDRAAQASQPASLPAPATPARNRLGIALAVGLLAVLGAIIASHWPVFTRASLSQASPNAATQGNGSAADLKRALAELSQRLQAAEARLGQADRAGTPAPPENAPNLADIATRLGAIDARMNGLESRIARAADRDGQTALQDRMSRLESETSGAGLRRAANILALATLARAAGEAHAFKPQFDALSALAPDDPAVASLAPYAAQGVPTLAMLRARFPEAERIALDAERGRNAGASIFGRLWASLTGLIRIRRVGDVSGNTSADRLARAEADMGRADLAGAADETRGLTGPTAAAMAVWLKDAEARIAIDHALDDLDLRIVQALAAPGDGSVAARRAPGPLGARP